MKTIAKWYYQLNQDEDTAFIFFNVFLIIALFFLTCMAFPKSALIVVVSLLIWAGLIALYYTGRRLVLHNNQL